MSGGRAVDFGASPQDCLQVCLPSCDEESQGVAQGHTARVHIRGDQQSVVGPPLVASPTCKEGQVLQHTPLWSILQLLATSHAAADALHHLHSAATEEARINDKIHALEHHIGLLRVELSAHRKFDCRVMVNLKDLSKSVHATLEQVALLRTSKCVSKPMVRSRQ